MNTLRLLMNNANIASVPDEIIELILSSFGQGVLISFKFVNKRFCLLVGSINVKAALFGSVQEGFVGIFAEFFEDAVKKFNLHTRVCATAASNGQLGFIKYLRENGCPWDEYSCSDAATN